MLNPFIGSEPTDFNEDLKPLELVEDFETRVYPSVKEPKTTEKKIQQPISCNVLRVRGKPSSILSVSQVSQEATLESFKQGWLNHRGEEKQRRIVEKTTDVIEVPKTLRSSYVKDLKRHTEDFVAFMVSELSPSANAFETAIDHSEQILKLITKSEQDMAQAATLRAMLRDAMQMKALHFIATKMGLTDDQKSVLVEKYFKPRDVHVHQSSVSKTPQKPNQGADK